MDRQPKKTLLANRSKLRRRSRGLRFLNSARHIHPAPQSKRLEDPPPHHKHPENLNVDRLRSKSSRNCPRRLRREEHPRNTCTPLGPRARRGETACRTPLAPPARAGVPRAWRPGATGECRCDIKPASSHSHPRVYHFPRPINCKMRIDLGCPLIIFSPNSDGEYRLEIARKIHP